MYWFPFKDYCIYPLSWPEKIVGLLCSYLPTKTDPTHFFFFFFFWPFWRFFFYLFCKKAFYIHYNIFIINFIFSCFEILYFYGQHFEPYTVYSKRKSISDSKKKKKWPTYPFRSWWVGTQQTKNILRMALLCWGLTTRQPLWVILCCLPEKREKRDRRDGRGERLTGMKIKKQKK